MGRLGMSIAQPKAHGGLGSYSYGSITGIIPAALAADSELFQFRWDPSDTTRKAVVRKVGISAAVSTTYFAAGVPLELSLIKATAWTAAGTGGSSPTPAALLKRDSGMGNSLIAAGDIRLATTAALGAGTKTLEGVAMNRIAAGAPITASLSGQIFAPGTMLLDAYVDAGEYPLVLADQEGFVITCPNVPATGTWKLAVNVVWDEVSAYPYT